MNDQLTAVSGSDTKSLIIGTLGFLAVASYYYAYHHHHNKKDKRTALKRSVNSLMERVTHKSVLPESSLHRLVPLT
jgi:hypothetical protein